MTEQDIAARLDQLESLVEHQNERIDQQEATIEAHQERIQEQQERIQEQQETIQEQRERIAGLEAEDQSGNSDESATQDSEESTTQDSNLSPMLNRRNALKAGGLLALLAGGTATTSADPSGQIGTSSAPLEALYTDELYGNEGTVTVQDDLDLNGNNLTSTSVGTDISTDVDSTVTGEEDFALEIEDASGTKPTVRWRRESNTDNALVVQTDDGMTATNRLLLGDNGNLEINGNASVTGGPLSVTGGGASITGGPLSVTGGGASITGGNLDMGAANAVELNTDDLGGDYSRPTQGHLLFGMADDDAALLLGEAGSGGANDGQFVIRTQDDGDEEILLQQHNSAVNGSPVTQLRIDEFGDVRINNNLRSSSGTTIWDAGESWVPQDRLENDSVTVAGNSVTLGGSTGVDYVDLADTGSSFPIPNGDLANDSLTVTAGAGLTGGGSVSLGGTTSVSAATTEADVARTFTESDVTVTTDRTTVNTTRNAIETTTSSSTATRSDDADTFSATNKYGLEINPNLDLGAIELEVSSMTSGETTVYLLDTSENVLAQAPSPGAGNTVTFRASLSAGTTYYVAVDAGGSSYTAGYFASPSFPFTSSAVDIEGGYKEGAPSGSDANTIDDVTGYPVGRATVEWSEPASVSRWDTAAFQTAPDGEFVEVFVETSSDGGSTWSTWDPDGDGTPEPVAPGTDLSSIPAGDRVRFRVDIVRFDDTNEPRLTLLSRQWRP